MMANLSFGCNEHLFSGQKLSRFVDEESRVRDGSAAAKVTGGSRSVLDGKQVISTVPLQALMAQPEGVSMRCRHCGKRSAPYGRATFGSSEIEPAGPETQRPFHVIDAHIDVTLRQNAVLGDNVRPRARQERHGHLGSAKKTPILDTAPVAAHVQRIEVGDLNMLAPVV